MTTLPRLFHLQRDHDVTGVSGTGRVADGVLWPDGTVSIRWTGPMPSTVFWHSLANALHVHGHGGATRIVWADETAAAGTQPVDQATVGRALDALRAGNHITAKQLLEAATAAGARQNEEPPAEADVEHCVHSSAVHARHHHQPVTGCPWCTAATEQQDGAQP